jgi:8-oxo-dGTP diphosphatase
MSYTYKYPRPAITVDALVLARQGEEWQVLLIQRRNKPFQGHWALPGGFVNMDETLEQAAIRELVEETGLRLSIMEQFRVFDAIDRDPRHRTISVVFYSFLQEIPVVTGEDDALAARWWPLSGLPSLAFDHSHIITEFIKVKIQDSRFKIQD